MVGSTREGKAPLLAKGYRDPDLDAGLVGTPRCVSPRSSNLEAIFLVAPKKWELRSLDIKSASLRADGFGRDAYLRAPSEWDPRGAQRIWKLRAPGYGLHDAALAFRKTLNGCVLQKRDSLALVGLKFQLASVDPCLYCVSGL